MTEKISNIPTLKAKRRKLRNGATPQEVILWSRLKKGQLAYKFRRQHSFGRYVVDFYCPEKRLVIEVDGSQHAESANRDNKRTEYFKRLGLKVVRFWNNQINTNIEGAVAKIKELLED
jgi:very-short-patch-repair endonuclease